MNKKAYNSKILALYSLSISVLAGFGAVLFIFGSLGAFGAFIQGYSLYCPEPEKTCIVEADSENQEVLFSITNLTREPIRLIGADTSCGCVVAKGLPASLTSRSTSELRLNIATKGIKHRRREHVKLLAQPPGRSITLHVIVEPEAS